MNAITITVTGNLAADPELRVTNSGKIVTNFTLIANDRRYDQTTKTWVDARTTAFRITTWGTLAEHTADTLVKGSRVTITGHRVRLDTYLTREGDAAATCEVTADQVAVDLATQKAAITRQSATT